MAIAVGVLSLGVFAMVLIGIFYRPADPRTRGEVVRHTAGPLLSLIFVVQVVGMAIPGGAFIVQKWIIGVNQGYPNLKFGIFIRVIEGLLIILPLPTIIILHILHRVKNAASEEDGGHVSGSVSIRVKVWKFFRRWTMLQWWSLVLFLIFICGHGTLSASSLRPSLSARD
jgi:hypothetical protein